MSIPLDRLYHFIEDIAKEIFNGGIVIYRFFPHGSKKIKDLKPFKEISFLVRQLEPEIYCNDQEPLNHKLYQNDGVDQHSMLDKTYPGLLKKHSINFPKYNFRGEIRNIWDHALLLHSEQRSEQLVYYKDDQFIPVYYWSHALISLDWFRFAEYVKQEKQVKKLFLIYNRAWGGTREYRLRFTDMLVQLSLQEHCQTTVNTIEPELGVHYDSHQFRNPVWRPQTVIENYFPISNAHSHYSADFDIEDYESTEIEVVLETLFDDARLHLTEKSLRPIACGQPFILTATHGSLEYLRSYGFKTFDSVWDESYDQIADPEERLMQIVNLMKHIANWSPETRADKMAQAQIIANYNKNLFFNEDFVNTIVNELKTNLTSAFDMLKQLNRCDGWMNRRNTYISIPGLIKYSDTLKSKEEKDFIFQQAQKYYLRHNN